NDPFFEKMKDCKKKIKWLLLVITTFMVGCNKGPFTSISIEGYSIVGDRLYVLFREEVGINRANRGSASNGFTAQAVSLVLAECSLSSSEQNDFKTIGG